jgi:hypothetical protein
MSNIAAPPPGGASPNFLTTAIRCAATGVVAGIAAYVSYRHVREVVGRYGETEDIAALLPLSVDGLIVVASLTMVDDHRRGRPVAWVTRLAFWLAVCASLAANVLHAQPSGIARVVAAWPSVALLLTVEVLARPAREDRPEAGEARLADDLTPPVLAEASPDSDLTSDPALAGPSEVGQDSLAAVLDRLGVPREAGRDKPRQALTGAGVQASTAAIAAAVRARKNGTTPPGLIGVRR